LSVRAAVFLTALRLLPVHLLSTVLFHWNPDSHSARSSPRATDVIQPIKDHQVN